MKRTAIEWTEFSANPIKYQRVDTGESVWACVKASEGCQHCYAESLAKRFQGGEFTAGRMATLTPYVDEAELKAMLSPAKLPAGSKVFVGDMTDMFGPWVPFEMLDRVFAVFALRPDVVFQVLTKRPERMREYMMGEVEMRLPVPNSPTLMRPRSQRIWLEAQGVANNNRSKVDFPWSADWNWPLPNVWLGTSAEDQHWADVRIPELLATPAAVRFISAEPLLGELYFTCDLLWKPTPCPEGCGCSRPLEADVADCACDGPCCFDFAGFNGRKPDIDWVIVGGESGPGARPMDVAWAREIVEQCKAEGVAVFVKQLGAMPWTEWEAGESRRLFLKSRKGGMMDEWPQDLRIREMPISGVSNGSR